MNPTSKTCSKCKTLKPIADFWGDSKTSDGRKCSCKDCHRKYKKTARYRTYASRYNKSKNGLDSKTKNLYGISRAEYESRLHSSDCCDICGVSFINGLCSTGKFSRCLDHNHETGVIRGVLCGSCNRAIGLLRDDPELIRKAADYIEYYV